MSLGVLMPMLSTSFGFVENNLNVGVLLHLVHRAPEILASRLKCFTPIKNQTKSNTTILNRLKDVVEEGIVESVS